MERASQLEKEYETLTALSNGEEDQPVSDISKVLDSYWKSGEETEIKVTLAQAGDILTWLSSAVKDLRTARTVGKNINWCEGINDYELSFRN